MPTINLNRKKIEVKTDDNHKIYNSRIWRNLRISYLMENPLCEECLKNNKVVGAIDVHHKIPISRGKNLEEKRIIGYDYNNLKSLCKDCHKLQHK